MFNEYIEESNALIQIYNNVTIEILSYIKINEYKPTSYIYKLIGHLAELIHGASKMYKTLGRYNKSYICISLIGCKGLVGEEDTFNDYYGKVDRNEIYCIPIEVVNLTNDDEKILATKRAERVLSYAMGVRYNDKKYD